MSGATVRAGIDVGTNAVKCVVAKVEGGRILETLHEDRRVTRLGEGVHAAGRLRPVAIVRTCEAIAAMADAARALGAASIRSGATSAARDADNAGELIRCVHERSGLTLEVLLGEEEARLTFLAIRASDLSDKPLAVMDPGGGSTEWVLGEGDQISARYSAPVGAVRVTERWLPGDPPAPGALEDARAGIAGILEDAPPTDGRRLVGTGGTLRNLASVYQHHARLSWEDACRLPLAEVKRQIAAYAACSLSERREIPGLEPDRADIILGGALVVEGCYHHARVDMLTVTNLGLRHGLAISDG